MDRTCDLGSSPMVPLFVHYALPSIIGKVVSALYNMVAASSSGTGTREAVLLYLRSFTFVSLLGTIIINDEEVYHYGR
jgi:hypothetical protein